LNNVLNLPCFGKWHFNKWGLFINLLFYYFKSVISGRDVTWSISNCEWQRSCFVECYCHCISWLLSSPMSIPYSEKCPSEVQYVNQFCWHMVGCCDRSMGKCNVLWSWVDLHWLCWAPSWCLYFMALILWICEWKLDYSIQKNLCKGMDKLSNAYRKHNIKHVCFIVICISCPLISLMIMFMLNLIRLSLPTKAWRKFWEAV